MKNCTRAVDGWRQMLTAVLVALGGLGQLAAAPALSPIVVSDVPEPRQTRPAVSHAGAAGIVVTWVENGSGLSPSIHGRRFAANGAPLDGGFRIADPQTGVRLSAPDVASDSAGNFVVVWQTSSAFGTSPARALARRYTADGVAAGPPFEIDPSVPADREQGIPAVDLDAAGNAVIAWSETRFGPIDVFSTQPLLRILLSAEFGEHRVLVRRYGPDGAPRGAPQTVADRLLLRTFVDASASPVFGPLVFATVRNLIVRNVDVGMNDNGQFTVAWGGSTTLSSFAAIDPVLLPFGPSVGIDIASVFARRHAADGRPLGPPQLIHADIYTDDVSFGSSPSSTERPSVAMDDAGTAYVAWSVSSTVMLRPLYARGLSRGRAFELTCPGDRSARGGAPRIAVDRAGRLYTTFSTFNDPIDRTRICVFAADGSSLGSRELPFVSDPASGFEGEYGPVLDADADGRVAAFVVRAPRFFQSRDPSSVQGFLFEAVP